MEDLFKEFRAWLGATEEKLGGLSPPAGESGKREQQLQEAKVGRWMGHGLEVSREREGLEGVCK